MRRQFRSKRLRTIAAAAAVTVGALGLGVGAIGSADAATVHPAASCGTPFQVGDSIAYNNAGMVAGWVSQFYDPCVQSFDNDTNLYVVWRWNQSYTQLYGTPSVQLYVGSMGWNNGQVFETNDFNAGLSSAYDLTSYEIGIHSASPDSWRVGAGIGQSNCIAWTSQHYYAIGAETAGPYGGCGDNVNISSIPWTQP